MGEDFGGMTDQDIETADDLDILTPAEIEKRIRWVSRELILAIDDAKDLPERIAQAEDDYTRAYHQAYLDSNVDHPERKVGVHQSAATMASADELRIKVLVTEERRIRSARVSSLQSVLSVLQSQLKSANGAMASL